MGWMGGVVVFLRAIVNVPETKHWIDKYEAAKKDNKELREENERLRKERSEKSEKGINR